MPPKIAPPTNPGPKPPPQPRPPRHDRPPRPRHAPPVLPRHCTVSIFVGTAFLIVRASVIDAADAAVASGARLIASTAAALRIRRFVMTSSLLLCPPLVNSGISTLESLD